MRLEGLSWKKAEEYFKTHDMAVIPVGSIENHGPHLALGTDYLVPVKLTEQIDRESDVLIVPAVPYGVADSHTGFAGTITIGYDGLRLVVGRICEQLFEYGVRRFVFLNGHGGNNIVLQHIGAELNKFGAISAVVNWWQIAGELNPAWKGGHGGGEETAAVMAINPNYVCLDDCVPMEPEDLSDTLKCTSMSEVSLDGVPVLVPRQFIHIVPGGWYGPDDPRNATAEWGQEMLKACGDFIVKFIDEFGKAKLPV